MKQLLADRRRAAGRAPVMRLGGTWLPLAGRARVYVCGITPYDVTHLGHAATFVWADALSRVLHAGGALASDLDVPAALGIAEDQGGPAARTVGSLLALW